MKVVYLACQETLPGSENRRVDAFEHDLMMAQLQPAFKAEACELRDVLWDDKTVDWPSLDAVIIGTTWDYTERYDEYLKTINQINAVTPVFNSPSLVDWNTDKRYLRDLASDGVRIIPTHWVDDPETEVDWASLFDEFDTDKLVIKHQVGANADGQVLLKRGDSAPTLDKAVMIQPFLRAVQEEGEHSMIFIDGQFSHALTKQPASGDYRIQSAYGGIEIEASPPKEDVNTALSVLEALPEKPLYARVDMLRDNHGQLSLIELELVEPFLYPVQGPELGTRLIQALKRKLQF
ncbi:MAG: hypothetical protein AAF431_11395 [Pseudomonadota bacterium]